MKKFLKTLFLFTLFASVKHAHAAFDTYTTLTNLPNVPKDVPTTGGDLAPYLNSLYTMGVAAAAGLAVIMVIWGGVEYITAVAGEGKSGGKERITSAILGLLLALGSYIILNTINPDLLKLSFVLPDAKIQQNANATNPTDYTGGVDTADLSVFGFTLDSDGNVLYKGQQTGYLVDSTGDIVDSNGNPAGYIDDTPLNITNFAGSLKRDSSGNVTPDNSVGGASSNLANLLAQSSTDALGKNLGQGTPINVACSSTTCSILNNVGLNYGNLQSTIDLQKKLSSDNRLKLISEGTSVDSSILQGGDIIVTVTANEKGHTGVYNTNGLISNNQSSTGLVRQNDTSWWNTYVSSRPGLTTYVYRAK